jgi:phosphoribosylamine--glycine ligase
VNTHNQRDMPVMRNYCVVLVTSTTAHKHLSNRAILRLVETPNVRILFVSKEGDGLGIAQRLAFEGHSVDVYVSDSRFKDAGRGLVNRVPEWRSAARRADLIIADCVGLGRCEDSIRSLGRPAIGFCAALDVIELDRRKGMELFEHAGIKTPETLYFNNAAEALKLPGQHGWGDGWVVKANGNISTAKTAVVKDEQLWPQAVKQLPAESSGIIQRIVSGVEVSTEGWFNGSTFVRPFNHTFEDKRFLAGDLGQNTGCMGNIIIRADSSKLTRATIERTEPFLRMLGYRGPFDINTIVNAEGAWALEVTSRMGYDAVEALAEGLDEPFGDFLFDIAMGTKKEMALTHDTMIAVRLSVPPWPMRKPDRSNGGEPILGINDDTLLHLFLTDIAKDRGQFVTAGGDGVLLKATAIGAVTPPKPLNNGKSSRPDYTYEARRRVYRTLDKIKVSNKQYRTDIGVRVNEDMAKLKEWGWL